MTDRLRIVICGAGIVGVSTAYYLSQARSASSVELDVTVVDSLGIAQCASGKAGGFLALGWSDSAPLEPLARAGWALHMDLMAELGPKAEDVGYRRLNTFSATLDARPSDVTEEDKEEGEEEEYGEIRGGFEVGAGAKPSGNPRSWLRYVTSYQTMGTPRDTAQVHPGKLTNHLMVSAQENGVKFRSGMVNGFRYHDVDAEVPRVAAVLIDEEELLADIIVIAMGPWSGRASRWLPPRSNFPSAITGSVAYSITLKPETIPPPHAVFMDYRDARGGSDAEVYPRPDEVYMCTGHPDIPLPDRPSDIRFSELVSRRLFEIATKISPLLATARQPDRRQTCFLPLSPDGKPLIGRVAAVKGVKAATGHSCWGILTGPVTGKVVSEIIIKGSAETVDIGSYDPARFARRASRH